MTTSTNPTATHGARNTDIECLRAIAVLGVAFHHMQGNLFHPGLHWINRLFQHAHFWFGVDLFFAISGFVIARSLLPQLLSPEHGMRERLSVIGAFWIRRFWRLQPAAWFWLAVILLACITFNRSGVFMGLQTNAMATLAAVFNVANFRFAEAFGQYPYGTSFVYWSLSLEEQFYIALPLVVLLVRRRIDLVVIALFVAQLLVLRTPLLMVLRTDAMSLGVLLAMVESHRLYARASPTFLLKLGPWRVALPCLLLAVLAVLASSDLAHWAHRMSAIAVVAAALVWIASYDRNYLLPVGGIKRGMVWLGARSYAIYLIHIPVYFALRELLYRLSQHGIGHPPAWLLAIVAISAIILLADLNYRYLEQPLRRHGIRISDRFFKRRTGGGKLAAWPNNRRMQHRGEVRTKADIHWPPAHPLPKCHATPPPFHQSLTGILHVERPGRPGKIRD